MKRYSFWVGILIGCVLSSAFGSFHGDARASGGQEPPFNGDMIWIEDFSGCMGDMIEVNVMISNADTPVDAFGCYIHYDAGMLDYIECAEGDLDPGWVLFGCNEPEEGEIRTTAFAYPGVIPAGSNGSIITLTFQVTCWHCIMNDQSIVSLSDLTADIDGWEQQGAVFTYSCPPTPTPTTNDLVWIEDAQGCSDDTIMMTVMLTNPDTAVDAFGLYAGYDADALEFLNCTEGDLDPDWTMFGCNEPVPRQIRATGFSHSGSIPAGSSGSLAALRFRVKCESCSIGDEFEVTLFNLTDDFSGWIGQAGTFVYYCTPTPTATPTPADVIMLENFTGCTQETIDVDVVISNPETPVDAFGFYLQYCTDMMQYMGCSEGELDPGWTMFGCNESESGEIRATGFVHPDDAVPAGSSGSLVTLTFQITCPECVPGAECELAFSNLTADLDGWTIQNGSFAYFCTPTPFPTPATYDGITVSDFAGCHGDTVNVPVNISNPDTPVDAFGFHLVYCTDQLQYVECSPGTLDPGWVMFGCNEPVAGEIRTTGFVHPDDAIPADSSGSLVVFTFQVNCPDCINGDECELFISHLTDDLEGWGRESGTFSYYCGTSTPTASPTNSPTVTLTPTPPPTNSPTSTATFTPSPTFSPTDTPTETPTASPTHTPVPSMCPDNAPVNPGFENWYENGPFGPPDNWHIGAVIGYSAIRETGRVFDGNYSCRLAWTNTLTKELYQVFAVYPNESYDFRLRYLDDDTAGRIRYWIRWEDATGGLIDTVDGGYSRDSEQWQMFEMTDETSPASAAFCRVQIRMYDVPDFWDGNAQVIVDNVEVCGNIPHTPTPSPTFTHTPSRTPTLSPSNTPSPTPTDSPTPTASPTLTPSPLPTDTPTATPVPTMCDNNALENPGFESWIEHGSGGPPDDWRLSDTNGFHALMESDMVWDGNAACALEWTSDSTRELYQRTEIIPGELYDVKLRCYDFDPAGRIRLWIVWEDSEGYILDVVDGGYSIDMDDWQTFDILQQEAPLDAAYCVFQIRMYDVSEGWDGDASVIVDNAELCGGPVGTPTQGPTLAPTPVPTDAPTEMPTEPPTTVPTEAPTIEPSPSAEPTREPTTTGQPTGTPTTEPTPEPSMTPSQFPTEIPTVHFTETPFLSPTPEISRTPTQIPTQAPIPALSTEGSLLLILLLGMIFHTVRKKKN